MKRRSLRPTRASLGPYEASVHAEQVAMLFARNRVPTLIGVPFSLLICAFAWADGSHGLLIAWLGLKTATAAIRVALDALYRAHPERATTKTWSNRHLATLALDGIGWSILILLFTGGQGGELAPVLIAAVIGIGSSGAVALSTDRRANAVFAFTLLVPGAARLLFLGSRLGLFGGLAMILFLAIVVEHGVRVSDSTAELLRLRFEVGDARDAAVAAGKSKSDFLATMSHELRTPLNAVIGMSSLLADTELTADQRERLDLIRSSGETLLTLIGDILDVSKIEAGKLEVEAAPVNLARVVEDALQQIAQAAFERGLEIGYVIAPDCPAAVVSDPTRVRQVLTNLLGNAVKFTPDGSIVVRVDAEARDDDRVEVTFAIRDTGIGIEPEAIARLFVPFTQADTTTTRRYGGTGLGLAICKSLSELLGGTIGAESAVGEGSTFHFSIVAKALDVSRPRALPINQGARVCVASADATARELLGGHVSGVGLIEVPVASLAGAVELVAGGGIDLVVLDARDAADDAMRAVRALRDGATTPVLVLLPPSVAAPFRAGSPVDALVASASKPVGAARLLEMIEALLAGQPAPARQSSMADIAPASVADPRGGSALVVDDNELNRRVALEMVRRLGLSARAVGSGAEAIDAAARERFDYILMDVQMPDMDGFEATARILAIPAEKKPRIVAMTANALPGDRERCLSAGMSDYVTKPVRPAALAAALRRHYEGTPGTGERSGITDVLDAGVLEDLRMLEETSGASLIADLAASFRADVPARIEDLRAAVLAQDLPQIRSLAHRLRGSAGAVGANRVFVTATEIEMGAASTSVLAMTSLVDHLAKETSRAIDALERVIGRTKRSVPKLPESD